MKTKSKLRIVILIAFLLINCSGSDNDPVIIDQNPDPGPNPEPISEFRVPCVDPVNTSSPYKIKYDYSAAVDIIPTSKVIDSYWESRC